MTDLKNMSVDELREEIYGPESGKSVLDEMARRLREQERSVVVARDLADVRMTLVEEERRKVHQAESALLACQAREAELIEACQAVLDNTEDYHAQVKKIRSALSHSTGSKIMAVVEAAKAVEKYCTNHGAPHGMLGDEAELVCQAVRALEAKHGEN